MTDSSHPMQPWPDLAEFGNTLQLPQSGAKIFLFDSGNPSLPPLLLVHGLGDEADTWRHVFRPLSGRYRVLALDLPGFGRSDKPERGYSLPFFKDTLLEVLSALGVERAVLAGHSLGGAIVHTLALAAPEKVARLVLIGGSLVNKVQKVDLATLLFVIPGLGEWMYNRLRKDPQGAYRSLDPYYNDLESLPEADRQFLYRRVNARVWDDGQRRAFLSTLRSLARSLPAQQKTLPDALAHFEVPTRVLWGANDRISSVENGRALLNLQPAASLEIIPRCGHNLHQEKPDTVIQAILE